MTKDQILQFIQGYMPQAMLQLERSRARGHLVYPQDVFNQYDDLTTFIQTFKISPKEFLNGYTSSTYFERKLNVTKWGNNFSMLDFYQLKKGLTPSEALDDVLSTGTTTIDCIIAVNIAWYLCIRALLIYCHNETEGKNKFNLLFDQKNHPFIISPYDLYTLTGSCSDAAFFSTVPILSYFMKKLHDNDKNYTRVKSDPLVIPGTRVTINNDPKYVTIHGIGPSGAINMICVGKDAYMGFGLGTQPLTEAQVLRWLKQELDQPAIQSKKPWLKDFVCAPKEMDYDAGYFPYVSTQFDIDTLYQLIHDFSGILNEIQVFINDYETQQILQYKNFRIDNHYPIEIEFLKEIIKILTESLKLQKDPILIQSYAEALASHKAELGILLAQSQTTQKIVRPSIPTLPSTDKKTLCFNVLLALTEQKFKFNDNRQIFWITLSKNSAANLAEVLTKSHNELKVSCQKVTDSENYCVIVDMFDPEVIKKKTLSHSF